MAEIISLLKREVKDEGVIVGFIATIGFVAGYPIIRLMDSLS